MIETRDTTELFEQLERTLAEESLELEALKRAVTVPQPKPRRVRLAVTAIVAGLLLVAAGIGAGMLIQYQDTQDARDQVTELQGTLAYQNGVSLFNMPTAATRAAELQAMYQMKAMQVAPEPAAISKMPTVSDGWMAQWLAAQQTEATGQQTAG